MYKPTADFLQKKFNFDAHYFLKGGFWLGLTQIITIIGGLITSVLFAHYLTPQDFGIYRYLVGLSALFAAFSLTGIGQSILQTTAKGYYNFYTETLKTNFSYSLLISITAIIGSVYYAINENFLLASGCLSIALLQPLISSFSYTSSYLQGRQLYKESTFLQLGKVVIVTIASIASIFITENVLFLFLTFLISNVVVNYFGYIFNRPANSPATPNEMFATYKSYALHTSLRNIIANVANRVDTIVVFTQLGAIELAIYTVATLVPEQIKGSFKNLANLLLPKYAAHDDFLVLQKSIPKRSLQLLGFLVLTTVMYILISPYIYQLIFPKYPEAIILSQIAALAFPSFVFFIPHSILQSRLAEKELYSLQIVSSVSQIILTIFLTMFAGLIGAITAKIIYRYIFMVLSFYRAKCLR